MGNEGGVEIRGPSERVGANLNLINQGDLTRLTRGESRRP